MSIEVFERREIKYRLTPAQRTALEARLAGRMVPDEHGESLVCSVYYDTPDYRLIRASLEKPAYKEKLRLRSYGVAAPGGEVFLELKKKYRGVVYKRRISLPERDAGAFLSGCAPLAVRSQIAREIEYFTAYYDPLRPAVYLSYERSAWVSPAGDALRVTFDRNILFRQDALSLTAESRGRALLAGEESLMEIKTPGAIPLWLTAELDALSIYQTTFSKYGEAYKTMLAETLHS